MSPSTHHHWKMDVRAVRVSTPSPQSVGAEIIPSLALLVMAKAPEPGKVKTRLLPHFSPSDAARLAAAALLDTMEVVDAFAATSGDTTKVTALQGHLVRAIAGPLIAARLIAGKGAERWIRIPQRGACFAQRSEFAHLDAGGRSAVLQIGMDTPQISTTKTLLALRSAGLRVTLLLRLTDVDTYADAVAVSRLAPRTRFAREFRARTTGAAA